MQEYSVMLGGEVIGTAHCTKEGLYWRICIRCALSGEVSYRVVAKCGDREADLGLCVPAGDRFGLETRIPIKRLGESGLSFCAVPKKRTAGRFIRVSPDEPFRYIASLENAFLERREGAVGILLQNDSSRPTGQWSEPNTSE